jgi:hypothetical protein
MNILIRSIVLQLIATGLAGVLHAQTLTDIGATAPTPGTYDISQLSVSGNKTAPDGLNYYTDNQSDHNAGEPGQTFTTGTNPGGYMLTSVALRTGGLGSSSGTSTAQPYYLHVYSVSGSTATLVQTYTSGNITFNDGDWLKWNSLSVPLSANTTYAYSFGKASMTSGYESMAVASGNPKSGGEIALISPTTGTITTGGSHNFDAVFDLGLVLATTPGVSAVTISPAANVRAGIQMTFAASDSWCVTALLSMAIQQRQRFCQFVRSQHEHTFVRRCRDQHRFVSTGADQQLRRRDQCAGCPRGGSRVHKHPGLHAVAESMLWDERRK